MKLPKKYAWLSQEGAPRHLVKALELYGTTEIVGKMHNPVIMGWAKELNLTNIYTSDEVPWCGLFMAIVMKRADRKVVDAPLAARSWINFGVSADVPMLGDVLVFSRKGGGHVGIYVGEDKTHFFVLGGNQGNQVNIVKIARSRLVGVRRPPYFNPPRNIRRIYLMITENTSTNES
jgi:uncharacterized protein (TIGR02594 family)